MIDLTPLDRAHIFNEDVLHKTGHFIVYDVSVIYKYTFSNKMSCCTR